MPFMMLSHTCITRNITMSTFMLSFKFPGSLNTASDNRSQGKSHFKCDLRTGNETNIIFCHLAADYLFYIIVSFSGD